MLRFLLRKLLWKTGTRLAGPRAARNARGVRMAMRLARRLRR